MYFRCIQHDKELISYFSFLDWVGESYWLGLSDEVTEDDFQWGTWWDSFKLYCLGRLWTKWGSKPQLCRKQAVLEWPTMYDFGNGYMWILTFQSQWYSDDDVIKWKHFPRYWPFVREFTVHRWILHTMSSDEEHWCFLRSTPE